MSGIRTNAAAELLGVSPNTLRSWERRFGFPRPRRTAGGHRQYDLQELEVLRRALLETHNISSAIALARQRGEGPASSARLVDAFDRFDEAAADRVMEESLAVRSVERTVEELLLPALEFAADRRGREAELEHACRWATGWLHAVRRLAPEPTRPEGVLLLDASGPAVDVEAIHVQALELGLRRAGFRVLSLSPSIGQDRVARALRALEPCAALVLCGREATLDTVGRLVYAARQVGSRARVFDYRDAMPVTGPHAVRSLGSKPGEAAEQLRAVVEGRAPEPDFADLAEQLAPAPARQAVAAG